MSSKLSNEQIQTVIASLKIWMDADAEQRTNSVVGKAIGYDPSTISLFVNNKYTGNLQKVALKVEDYLKKCKTYGKIPSVKNIFVQTSASDEIFMTVDFAQTYNKIGLIIGEQGGGKSIALDEASRRDTNTIYIPIPPKIDCKTLMILIGQPLGIDSLENSISENFRDSVNALKGSSRTVIFDEGEHLHVAEHEIIRRLQDFTNVPIILAGTDRLEKTLRGRRGELKQLSSRIAIKTEIPLLTLSDTKLILEANFPEAARFYETLHSVCKKNGRNLENLQNLLRYAMMKTGCSITETLIYESATRLLTQPS